ncbi:MAG: AAA family ATPase [Eubacterium sp.]|jgi:SpoVK/Ycf46/Vps4 family AAA+-type ATPase|nr:AAA family ATPase [Eubacterium sp.]
MEVKNLQSMISECITYADEITNNAELYPPDARMPLRDLIRYDMTVFLGFLYEPDNGNLEDQIAYIETNLKMVLTETKFLQLVEQKCNDPRFLNEPPISLSYFINADLASDVNSRPGSVAKSKFVVDCFRKMGEGFINYPKVKDETKKIIADYIGVMNATLNSAGIITTTHTSVLKMAENPHKDKGVAKFTDKSVANMDTISTFDQTSGQFVTKKAVSTSGYNIMKKRADDVSEFLNFKREEEGEDSVFKRGEGRVGRRRGDKAQDEIEKSLDELIYELQALTGLSSVKEDVMHLINIIKVRRLRELKGLKRIDMSFHLVFTGNPGTGKTTIARLLAKIYKQLGLVSKGQFIEVDRSGLVDHYAGGTAIKTTNVINKAIGGILFIDEAYTLTHNKESGDYGQEAVDTLLKRMEDDRDDFIVVVAGYTHEMTDFINSNPGLKSRFNKYIYFPDYTTSELMEIFKYMCSSHDYVLTPSAETMAETYLRGMTEAKKENFANARLVRNYFERCVDRQSTRIVQDKNITDEDLVTFVREDMIDSTVASAGALTKED